MDSQLFNEKTIARLCSNVNITAKQRRAAKEWLDLLATNTLKDEKKNYLKFANILLTELLEYPMNEIGYEVNNVEFSFKDTNDKTLVVIEAKGTEQDLFGTQHREQKDQATPIDQLWSYMSREAIPYGIATNYNDFVMLHFAKGNRKHYRFTFDAIKKDERKLSEFIAIFSLGSLKNGFVEKIEEESAVEEREFTKEFYKLFHETRLMLVKEYKEHIDENDAIHYAQLFLNRLMFILFAQDSDKLPQHILEKRIMGLLENTTLFSANSTQVSNMITTFYADLDKGSDFPEQIFGFNGGLFKEHLPQTANFNDFREDKHFKDVYQNSTLKKKELSLNEKEQELFNKFKNKLSPIVKNILLMASFDFNTEVNVNILGHIFEQSITDLEQIKEGVSKRKKEGIFYTPEYITDYICRNTIMPYLSNKQAKTSVELILEYQGNIHELENKFKNLRILDPACGSGAFLIKAVDVLLEIHREIQLFKQNKGEYTAIKKGRKHKKDESGQLILQKWHEEDEARDIIENSIFGVDLNAESVEITKLSLFIKIARKNRKLLDLSNNIKCGNSLIDDNKFDPRAFDWKKEFNKVLQYDDKGNLKDGCGFDIVIGNPPYVRQERFTQIKPELEKKYVIYSGVADLYTYFYEKGISVLKKDGYLGYISSNKWMKVKYGLGLRKLLKKKKLLHLIDFFELKVFEDASTEPVIVVLQNINEENKNLSVSPIKTLKFNEFNDYLKTVTFQINQSELEDEGWNFSKRSDKPILEIIRTGCVSLKEFTADSLLYGVKTGLNDVFVIDEKIKDELIAKSTSSKEVLHPIIDGVDIEKYSYNVGNKYLIFIPRGSDINNYPAVRDYLKQFYDQIRPKNNNEKTGRKPGKYKWYESQDNVAYWKKFLEPKIIFIHTAKNHYFAYDNKGYFLLNNCYFISSSNKYLLAFLNSKLFEFYKRNTFVAFGDAESKGRCKLDYNKMIKVPIKKIDSTTEKQFNKLVDDNIELREKFNLLRLKCIRRIKTEFKIEPLPKRLDSFYDLKFDDFIKIIEKYKPNLSLTQKDEWEDYFINHAKELTELKDKIDRIDKEIDNLVYDVYGIKSEKEKRIIEESLK